MTAAYQYPGDELDLFAVATNWKYYFAKLLHPHLRGRVLEVGAGIGGTTHTLWNDSVASWTCLEPDPNLAARLKSRVGHIEPTPDCIVGTIDDLQSSLRFDTILYIDVLEHIVDDQGELRSAARYLAPGGSLVVLSPAFQTLFSKFDVAVGHQRRYTSRSLARVFPAELTKTAVFYADSLGTLLSLGNRIATRQSKPKASQLRLWDRVVIPLSRGIDPLFRRFLGRSVIAVYRRPPRKS